MNVEGSIGLEKVTSTVPTAVFRGLAMLEKLCTAGRWVSSVQERLSDPTPGTPLGSVTWLPLIVRT